MTVSYKGKEKKTLVEGSRKTNTLELQAAPAKFLMCIPENMIHIQIMIMYSRIDERHFLKNEQNTAVTPRVNLK